ncbi:hypothetical protein [Rhizobium rhizogenes]|uniref:hypothetical protein n=1 Tax=Rhizobium rhizogenes TaxID=359 RepID=UPI001573AF49|nr:hypothetical protein [Rhizobium rhizogenes]NTF69384.1 hypothetical protein [Rhizobium rhizogenes]
MASKDIHDNLHFIPLFNPKAAVADDTAQVSAIIDTAGYESVELVIQNGANADVDATFAVLVQDGNVANLSDAATVPAGQLLGTSAQAGFTFADDNEARKIGYLGGKRYVRMTVTPTGNTGGTLFLSGVAVLGHPRSAPTPTLS